MGHTYVSALFHCVFSAKQRRETLTPGLRKRLFPYLGGIARDNRMKLLAVGGTKNHVHLLLSVPSTMDVAKAVQLIKGGSSKWLHDTFPSRRDFAWQDGYGAFSIGISQVKRTIDYINNQEEHHRKRTFKQEFRMFLKRHGIEYDERHVWGEIQSSLRDLDKRGASVSQG